MQKGFDVVNLHGTASAVIAVPVIGENGNWFLGNDDTGVKARGDDGATGPKGEPCEDPTAINVYSTKETLCGTWIDGKPIYRKVYVLPGEIPNNVINNIDISDIYTTIDRVVNLRGVVHNGSKRSLMPLPYATIINGEFRAISLYETLDKVALRCEVAYYALTDAYVYIEYTKKDQG